MTPTTAHRAVLKIHMASEARPLTGTEAPSEHRQQAEDSEHTAATQDHGSSVRYSQLVAVTLSMVDRFSMVHVTLDPVEMLTFRWLVMLYR